MSDGTQVLKFPYGSYLQVRLEFVLLRDDDLQARIMRIIEGWMIDQKKQWESEVAEAASKGQPEPPEPEYWCTLSSAQIIAQLYKFNPSRGGNKKNPNGKEVIEGKENTIRRATVASALHALIEDKYVRVRPNPNPTKEFDASQYTLNLPLIQAHMMCLPKNPMSYLGTNGRINGFPCPDFIHPPDDAVSGLITDPCTLNVQGMYVQRTSPCTLNVHPHVRSTYNLIESVIDSSKENTKRASTSTSDQRGKILTPQGSDSQTDMHASSDLIELKKMVDAAGGVTKLKALLQRSTSTVPEPIVEEPAPQHEEKQPASENKNHSQKEVLTPAGLKTPEQKRFWQLWSDLSFNQGIALKMPKNGIAHIATLAPHIDTSEKLESLLLKAQSDLAAMKANNMTVQLGNLVNSLPGWRQEQSVPKTPKNGVPAQAHAHAQPTSTMTEEQAEALAQTCKATVEEHGYKLKSSQAIQNGNGWVVSVIWRTSEGWESAHIESPEDWRKYFNDVHEGEQIAQRRAQKVAVV